MEEKRERKKHWSEMDPVHSPQGSMRYKVLKVITDRRRKRESPA